MSDHEAMKDGAPPQRPLTILQVVPKLNAGGVERGALEIAEAIAHAGGRALVASAGGRMADRLRALGAEDVRLPLASKNPLTMARNAAALATLIRREGVDIVHARSRAPAWSAYLAAGRAGARFVTTYHGAYSEGFPGKRLYNAVMAKGDPVIAISEFIADLVAARHGVPRGRIVVIPRGADLAQFAPDRVAPERRAALAARWGLAEDGPPALLLPGRLTRWKGQEVFLEALALLKAQGAAFAGVLVGGEVASPFGQELAARVAALGLEGSTRLVGHCDDMPAAYALAAAAVSASARPEAFGRVAVEAQAMGAPVIASAHGGAMETVAPGETGWLTPPGDAAALAAALAEALALSPERRAAMGAAGMARVAERFSVAAMRRATLSVYARVAGRAFS